jgi:hypothetical protein
MRHSTIIAVVGLLLLSVSPAFAQSRDPYFATFTPSYDVVYHEPDETSGAGAHFDIASTIKRDVPFLSLAGEIGVNRFEGATVSSFMGGVRLRMLNAGIHVLPFVQAFGGLYHCGACNINDFAIQGGGGVDIRFSTTNALRFRAGVDVRHTFDEFGDFNAVRVSAGIVIPLNR